jgi:hypothetical protein
MCHGHRSRHACTSLIKAIPNAAYARAGARRCAAFTDYLLTYPPAFRLQFMPFLLRALQLPDLQTRTNAIETFLAAGTHAGVFVEHPRS